MTKYDKNNQTQLNDDFSEWKLTLQIVSTSEWN